MPQLGLGLDAVGRERLQPAAEHSAEHLFAGGGKQQDAARRVLQRDPAADDGRVHDGVPRRDPLDHEHIEIGAHAELHVLADPGLDGVHVGQRDLAQSDRSRGAGAELPEPVAHAVAAIGHPLEQLVAHELSDDALGGRQRDAAALGDLGERQERAPRS